MIKEFEINDILNAVNEISKIERKKVLLKFNKVEETIAGTIKKITKGFFIPPVKYNKEDNCIRVNCIGSSTTMNYLVFENKVYWGRCLV